MNEIRTYRVYHRTPLWFPRMRGLTKPIQVEELGWPERYELVARVEAVSFEAAYRITQHLDKDWWSSLGVTVIVRSRSTSMGDVIIDPNGVAGLVAMIGFEPVILEEQLPKEGNPLTVFPNEEDSTELK